MLTNKAFLFDKFQLFYKWLCILIWFDLFSIILALLLINPPWILPSSWIIFIFFIFFMSAAENIFLYMKYIGHILGFVNIFFCVLSISDSRASDFSYFMLCVFTEGDCFAYFYELLFSFFDRDPFLLTWESIFRPKNDGGSFEIKLWLLWLEKRFPVLLSSLLFY